MAVILASQSPRRRELLTQMGLDFIIRPAVGEEIADPSLTPAQLVEELSRQKAAEVAATADPEDVIIAADTVVAVGDRVLGKPHSPQEAEAMLTAEDDDLIIAADTVVAVDGSILGKPHTPEAAVAMLTALSGRVNTVYTGVTVRRGNEIVTEHEATPVQFRTLSSGEIANYVATGEPLDKAGAYGIQGRGALLVEGIHGDYWNVVGLPICRLGNILRRFDVDPMALCAQKEQGI